VDETAGYLMLPYVAWVAFANFLNFGLVKKN
jgi:tryptophan-rich sensory protein